MKYFIMFLTTFGGWAAAFTLMHLAYTAPNNSSMEATYGFLCILFFTYSSVLTVVNTISLYDTF